MPEVAVRRLSLRVPSGHLAASRQQAEDALSLAAPDETRLMVLRRLDLGRLPSRAQANAWTERAGQRLAERRARAIHAAQPGAETAEAVWFRSIEEARELLLLLLVAGRRPSAWFWRLAVPDWRDLPLHRWLADWLAAARNSPPTEIALARAVLAAARAGQLSAIAAALAAATLPTMAAHSFPSAVPVPAPARGDTLRHARRLLARLDPVPRHAFATAIAAQLPGSLQALWLARLAFVAAAPELAGQGAVLASLAEASDADAQAPISPGSAAAPPGIQPTATNRAPETGPLPPNSGLGPIPRIETATIIVPPEPQSRAHATHDGPPSVPLPPGRASNTPDPAGDLLVEQISRGAGVLLAIRALDRLGLGDWLARDVEAAASGFGRHLLRHIAARARLPPEDPLFAVLEAPDPPPDAALLHAWRVGLDRWLRRRPRLRQLPRLHLSDLARRPGWLHLADSTLQARFPLDSADLRLRRLVLDADPGWVPWLGMSVRYHYRDSPLA